MAYNSEQGKWEGKGKPLGTSISGNGIFPVGIYKDVKVVSVSKQGEVMFESSSEGIHVETLEEVPKWLTPGSRVELTIGLTEGVYGRIKDGEVALFDSKSQERVSEWTNTPMSLFKGNVTIASPIITTIRKSIGNNATLKWQREDK